MTPLRMLRSTVPMLVVMVAMITCAFAQTPPVAPAPTPPTPAAPVAPASPVGAIRNKISAGDLLSAESILEVYVARNGQDAAAVVGSSWLARGAWLLGEPAKAKRYADDVRAVVAKRVAEGADLEKEGDLEYALGSALEVEAQWLERRSGAARAAGFVRGELARGPKPLTLRMRLQKRLAMLTLVGQPAPEISAGDFLGQPLPNMASLRGKPVLVFVWSATCGDCKAQAATLAKVKARYADRGLQVVALTRYHEADAVARVAEKARVDSVWQAVYADVGTVPVVFSDEAMLRYGGSSTPTLVFIDRSGRVQRYSPTRMTEAELDHSVAALLR